MPLFLQNFRGLGAMETGILLFPQALASGPTMPISGQLFDRFGPRPLMTTGLVLLCVATWKLSCLVVTTPDGSIRLILILRGVAMGLVMMPAMTTAMNTLVGPLVARGSALSNVLRRLFGAFGTAFFATMLQTRQTFHLAMLSQSVTTDSPTVRVAMAGLQRAFVHQGMGAVDAKVAALMMLSRQAALRATVMSFDDCFYVAVIVCIIGVLPALFLKSAGPQRRPGPGVAPAAE